MESNKELLIPGTNQVIRPGYKIKLGRFETTVWLVGFGWYSNAGNRPCCGWYLTSEYDKTVKPLQLTDLDDIYLVDIVPTTDDFGRSVEEMDREIMDGRLGADGLEYPSLGDSIRSQITATVKACTSIVPLSSFTDAPIEGEQNKLYIDLETSMSYVWVEDKYVPVSSKGDIVTGCAKNGYIKVNGEEVQVYSPAPIDSIVSSKSTHAVQSKAVHEYVENEVAALRQAIELQMDVLRNHLSKCIMYEITE